MTDQFPITINRSEAWVLLDGDRALVSSWEEKPSEGDVALEIMIYDFPTCTPFMLLRHERVEVWEYEGAVDGGGEGAKAYKIFGKENERIHPPVIMGKRKVTLR